MPETTLVDASTFYGTVAEVETWVRNKEFSGTTDLTTTNMEDKLKRASDRIDQLTGKAWRERTVEGWEVSPSISHEQKRYYKTARPRTSPAGFMEPIDPWTLINLQGRHVKSITSAQGDSIEVLLPREVADITAEEGRADGEWHLDETQGKLYIDVGNFSVGPVRGGGLVARPRVRLTYRYGRSTVPERINEAASKWVAADLINTDSYGAVLGGGPDNVPDMTTGASELFAGAMGVLNQESAKRIL